MEFLFILHYLSFLSVSIEQCEKITKEGVDQGVVHSTYYITKQPTYTRDIISNAPAVNSINRHSVFCMYYMVQLNLNLTTHA